MKWNEMNLAPAIWEARPRAQPHPSLTLDALKAHNDATGKRASKAKDFEEPGPGGASERASGGSGSQVLFHGSKGSCAPYTRRSLPVPQLLRVLPDVLFLPRATAAVLRRLVPSTLLPLHRQS